MAEDFSGRVTSLLNAQATATALGVASRTGLQQREGEDCFPAFRTPATRIGATANRAKVYR